MNERHFHHSKMLSTTSCNVHHATRALGGGKKKMALFTLLARCSDGLPLSSSIQAQGEEDMTQFQTRAKAIFRNLSPQSPPKCTIECPPLVFQ